MYEINKTWLIIPIDVKTISNIFSQAFEWNADGPWKNENKNGHKT